MKKILFSGAALAAVFVVTGCRMCSDPIYNDPTCIEDSHMRSVKVRPDAVHFTKPNLAASREVFRPVFRAGTKRVTVIGEGVERNIAHNDAIAKFLAQTNCDYIVAVTTIVVEKTHPTWRFFATSNYSVTLSGIPIYLDKLECETISAEEADKKATANNGNNDGNNDGGEDGNSGDNSGDNSGNNSGNSAGGKGNGIAFGFGSNKKSTHVCPAPAPAIVKLDNIKVSISADGKSDDKAGLIVPLQ